METKKLIEVALPLDKINEAAAYEKSLELERILEGFICGGLDVH